MHSLLYVLGLTNASGGWYLFWSGIAGDFVYLGAGYAIWRKHNCHSRGCWRIGVHRVDDSRFVVCRKHHPDKRSLTQVIEELGSELSSSND